MVFGLLEMIYDLGFVNLFFYFLFWVVGGGKTAKRYLFTVVELGGGWVAL